MRSVRFCCKFGGFNEGGGTEDDAGGVGGVGGVAAANFTPILSVVINLIERVSVSVYRCCFIGAD